MTILGISCFYHDAAAALLHNGTVVAAAAEERFSRKKHDNGFPAGAIKYCLDWLNIGADSLDYVAFYEKPVTKFERILSQHIQNFPRSFGTFNDYIPHWFSTKLNIANLLKKQTGYSRKILYYPHHLSHAASAFYTSGFSNAVILTVDGVGEWSTTAIGTATAGNISLDRHIRFPHSLGLLYSAVTSFLGFDVNDAEYKVMGLAAYGNPGPYRKALNTLVRTYPDGSYSLDMKYFDFTWSDRMTSGKMAALFGVPPREPESPMTAPYENIAAALQEKLEQVIFGLLNSAYRQYRISDLCLAGGVALNSVLNGKLLSHTPFRRLYIPPDPGDAGGAVGSALLAAAQFGQIKPPVRFSPYLGPGYTQERIRDILISYNLSFRYYTDIDELLSVVAGHLAHQKVIGWFQGRMEWGPRALGNRSILAAATKTGMKDILNSKVKHRELFRPFAPAILEEHTRTYFRTDKLISDSAKYMLLVYPFTPNGEKAVPATVHVDHTGRLQVVSRSENPLYYDLIKAYYKKTGVPAIVNTSFNVRGEPIVCTPNDAIECFLHTDIDYLVIGNFLVSKRRNRKPHD